MAKKIKAECITQNNNNSGSSATFAVKEKTQPAAGAAPGNIAVSFTANLVWKDDTGKSFTPGKEYTITIE